METTLNDICGIVSDLFNIPLDIVKRNKGKSLFKEPFSIRPTELLFLYFYLEEKYKVFFNEEDVLNFSFISIENITNIVNAHIAI